MGARVSLPAGMSIITPQQAHQDLLWVLRAHTRPLIERHCRHGNNPGSGPSVAAPAQLDPRAEATIGTDCTYILSV
jgi:hypothetical protein